MPAESKRLPVIFLCVIAAAGVGAALVARHRSPPVPALATGAFLQPRREVADFSLIDQHGRKFTRADLMGHWSMLFFGFTNCPDLCPTTLSTLAAMQKRLRAVANEPRPQVIFISVDAKRDTPAQLARYVPYFDPEFVGLTAADQPTIEAVARSMGVAVYIHEQAGGAYTVDHSAAVFVVDPAGRLSAVLTGPFSADTLRDDFRRIVAAGA